jgi:hypothetical protein
MEQMERGRDSWLDLGWGQGTGRNKNSHTADKRCPFHGYALAVVGPKKGEQTGWKFLETVIILNWVKEKPNTNGWQSG